MKYPRHLSVSVLLLATACSGTDAPVVPEADAPRSDAFSGDVLLPGMDTAPEPDAADVDTMPEPDAADVDTMPEPDAPGVDTTPEPDAADADAPSEDALLPDVDVSPEDAPLADLDTTPEPNVPPTITELRIVPEFPRSGDTLFCTYAFADPDGDADQSAIRWLVNEVEVRTGAELTDSFVGGDVVTCEVTPMDGTHVGFPLSVSELILRGGISGVVFLDVNGDGLRDAAEAGIEGRTVFLDDNGSGELDAEERSTVSDASGAYIFPDLEPGDYVVAQVRRDVWRQTYPVSSTAYGDEFEDGSIDPAQWAVTGDGIVEGGGVLRMDRNNAEDSVSFVPLLEESAQVNIRIRNTEINWQDMAHGFEIVGPCDTEREVRGIAFAFSIYGTMQFAQLRCNADGGTGAGFFYPRAYSLNTWYTWEVSISEGTAEVRVDGVLEVIGLVPYSGNRLILPGPWSDGDGGINPDDSTVSEIENITVEVFSLAHTVSVADGVLSSGFSFGDDG